MTFCRFRIATHFELKDGRYLELRSLILMLRHAT